MMIVKLTVLSLVITGIYYFAVWVWANSNEKQAALAALTGECPKWVYPMVLFIFFDVVGVFASAIYLLFIR